MLILMAVALTAGAAQADKKEGTTVIVKCLYVNDSGFATRVAGVDVAGSREAHFVLGMSCAQAFNALMDAGFTLVHSGKIPTTSGGVVDAADYVVWRRSL